MSKTIIKTKEKPILFNTEMVRALLNGRKTQTRRIIKHKDGSLPQSREVITHNTVKNKYSVGDILYVKETYALLPEFKTDHLGYTQISDNHYSVYSADNPCVFDDTRFISSLFMPRKFARIFLKVINIRVERLQDITDKDCFAEGIETVEHNCFRNYLVDKDWIYEGINQKHLQMVEDEKGSYASLWDSINGKKEGCNWDSNPYVFVIEFDVLKNYA